VSTTGTFSTPGPSVVDSQSNLPTGTITTIVGCMFSGKTTALLSMIARYPAEEVCAIRHSGDARYETQFVNSHAGARHPCVVAAHASDISGLLHSRINCLAIDEGHFFSDALVEVLARLRAQGLNCIVAALDRSSWGRPFPHVLALLRQADRPIICRTRCGRCGNTANRTQRMTPIREGNLVGGPADYEPRCLRCWRPPPEASPD